MRGYCRECGVFLCLPPGHNCLIKLYHSRTNKVAIECREFAVAKKTIKPDFMCFVGVGEDDNI